MEYSDIILEAGTTLLLNKLRTTLAILGIVIGIGSVIALVSLGQASQRAIESRIQSLGANLLTVTPGAAQSGSVKSAAGTGSSLTLEDATAIENTPDITAIALVSPEYSGRSQITTSSSNTNTRVIGVTPTYQSVHNIEMLYGSFITQTQAQSLAKVAVIGPTTAAQLFGDVQDPTGKTIRVGSQVFTIIGMTVSKGGTGFQNQDDVLYIPLSTAQKQLFGVSHISTIALQAKSADQMIDAQNQVGYFLLQRHNISDPSQADFSIFSQQDILSTASAATETFTTLLSGIAAISLLVGGIGIMNIMLVTVTERTREVGLKKALGAKKKVIIFQFLVESVLLTFIGGVIGIVLGVLISLGYSLVTKSVFVLSPMSVGIAFIVSAAIGVLFGWYPANKAADLEPIEALRYE